MTTEPVETFVFLPFSQYKALDSRGKLHSTSQHGLENPQPKVSEMSIATTSISKEEKQPKLERNVTKTYQSTQIQKIRTNIRKTEGSEELTSLPHLDDLIKAAISNTRKNFPMRKYSLRSFLKMAWVTLSKTDQRLVFITKMGYGIKCEEMYK